MGGVTQALSCVWLISLDMMSCWVFLAWVRVLCLFMTGYRSLVWMGCIWLAHFFLSGSRGLCLPFGCCDGGVCEAVSLKSSQVTTPPSPALPAGPGPA